MVGLDVTPATVSSRIIRASSPVCSHARESESTQTDWPSSETSCSRDSLMSLQFLDLRQPTHIALPAVELRGQERAHQLARQLRTHHLGADAEHVHVVVLDALVRRVRVVAGRRADPRELAGRYGRADSRAADQDTALGRRGVDRLTDFAGLVRIVDSRLGGVGPEVDRLVAGADDLLENALTELDATMVEPDRDPHREVTLHAWSGTTCGVSWASSSGSTPSARQR